MKTFGKILLGIVGLFLTASVFAQDGKWGADSAECVKNYSLFTTFYEQKNYEDAIKPWRYCYNNCPAASKNIFIKGVTMYNDFMKKEKDDAKYIAYIDTLFMVLNKRAEIFPEDKCKVEGYKGVYHYGFYKKDTAEIEVAYGFLTNSIDLCKNKTSYATLSHYVKSSIDLFMAGKKEASLAFDDYAKADKILEYQIGKTKKEKTLEKLKDVQETNKKLVVNFLIKPLEEKGEACNLIVPYFEGKYSDDCEIAVLKDIVIFLAEAGCTDDALYANALSQFIEKEPSVDAYLAGFNYFKSKKDYAKAKDYILKAIEAETEEEAKGEHYYKLGMLYYENLYNYPACRDAAYKAIKAKANWGKPYLLIGQAYAASANSCGSEKEPQKWGAYWAAVDKFAKAKAVDSDPDLIKRANNLIGAYSSNFPGKEKLFYHELYVDKPFTVGCWINETTTIRSKD